MSENFRAGALTKHGLDYASLKKKHKRLIYVSHKGFLPGPYDHRVALDEVVQMMAGLAYMTGPPGRPLRAGSSVNDIMGGMFGAIGALAALARARAHRHAARRCRSGCSRTACSSRRSTCCNTASTGVASPPMPDRINAWGVFDLFETSDGEQVFLGVVTDTQWAVFGRAFDLGTPGERSAPREQQSARPGARLDAARAARRSCGAIRRRTCRRCSSARGCPTRRSSGRSSCSTTRICSQAAGSPT